MTVLRWQRLVSISCPSPGGVDVYRLRLPDTLPAVAQTWLSGEERERAARFHFERDRLRFVWGRTGMRRLLGACLDLPPATVPITYASTGKPELTSSVDGLQFNLSHSGDFLLFAVARELRVGVDVEQVSEARDLASISRHVFAAQELAAFEGLPVAARTSAFFSAWARKEAVAKACGLGLSAMLQRVEVPIALAPNAWATVRLPGGAESVWSLRDLTVDAGYAAAVAVEGVATMVHTFALSPEDWTS